MKLIMQAHDMHNMQKFKILVVTAKGRIVFVQIAKNISGAQYAQVQDSGDGEG